VKGWRKPPNVVMVTRATRWGNPFVVTPGLAPGSSMHRSRRIYTAVPTAEDAVRRFREYMAASPDRQAEARRDLRGFDLAPRSGAARSKRPALGGTVIFTVAAGTPDAVTRLIKRFGDRAHFAFPVQRAATPSPMPSTTRRWPSCRDEYIDLMAGIPRIADDFAASH
jgi:hypothetical protein